jgi:hypothetical protein
VTGASNERRAFGQIVGSVPVGVFLWKNKNRHGGRVWGAYAHILNVRACLFRLFLTIDCLGARVCRVVERNDVKKLLNPFEWTQHTLDNSTSWVSLGLAEVEPGWCRGGAEVIWHPGLRN